MKRLLDLSKLQAQVVRKRLIFYVLCNSGGIKARCDSVYFHGCAFFIFMWYLFHLPMKLFTQLVLHNKSVRPEAN